MGPAQTLAAILGLSTVSGINLYLTVLLVGAGQRYGWIHGLPSDLAILSHPVVLGVAALLFLLEFLADKVPFITPIWDGLHTFIRPIGGALLALGAAGELHPVAKVLALLAGGTIALGTHGSKMGVRLLAHTAPEPASHSVLSVAEDLGVAALLALAYSHPAIALPVIGMVLVATALLLPLLLRALAFVLTGFRGALRSLVGRGTRDEVPLWAELKALELAPTRPAEVLPCFARRVKGLPRFHGAFLVQAGGSWHLVYRRWFRTRSLSFDAAPGPVRTFPGLLWDTAVFLRDGKPQILLTGRDWRHALPPVPATP
ncbi:DUF4126 domain-containing protein [Geothrix edaphica]|uniref:DUF4126 domain-containing protein n=1 Tax=Geothrix edaphica TaxID=2927976 RepID=A0ABQ5PTL7_9BACT|nr:DUF4126 domain-containing protein [Geothrix edaphica]GLH65772.1 hypothetical protein GETHED_01360 [Geothrix edaphica]